MNENKLSALAKRFIKSELKTLYKAGFVDDRHDLTDLGREHLEAIVLEDKLTELVAEAEEALKEKKEEKKD